MHFGSISTALATLCAYSVGGFSLFLMALYAVMLAHGTGRGCSYIGS